MDREQEITQFVKTRFIHQIKSLTEVYAHILIHSTLKQHEDHIAEFMISQMDNFMKCLPYMIQDTKKECIEVQDRIKQRLSITHQPNDSGWFESFVNDLDVELGELKDRALYDPTFDEK